ncbi:MAG: hypothetical protein R3F11_07305 [Verrucomicrobiales bacterium]
MLYRQLTKLVDLSDPDNAFVGAALSSSQMTSLSGDHPLPNFTDPSQFNFLGNAAQQAKFLGRLPTAEGAGDGKGMLGLYGGTGLAGKIYADTVGGTGKALGKTLETLQAAVGDYTPENGAVYGNDSFNQTLMEAAMLFKRTPARILGVNIGGWTTASNQGAAGTQYALGYVAQFRSALPRPAGAVGGSHHRDRDRIQAHQQAAAPASRRRRIRHAAALRHAAAFGPAATTREPGAMFSKRDRYLDRRDRLPRRLRRDLHEALRRPRAMLDEVIGYTFAEEDYPSQMGPAQDHGVKPSGSAPGARLGNDPYPNLEISDAGTSA